MTEPVLASEGGGDSLLVSFSIQRRVIGALLMREILTRFGRSNIGFMWLFFEPMLFTLGVTALWVTTRGAHGSNMDIVPFAITGYSSVLMWRNAATRCSKAIEPNIALLYHRNVTVLDLFVARLILEIMGGTISLLGLSIVAIATGWMSFPADVLTMVFGWFFLIWFAIGLGLIVGALTERSEGFERVWHIMTYLAFPVSGAMFMVEWLPKYAQEYALWVPMIHGVEMLRDGYYGESIRTHYSISYILMVNASMLLIGLLLVHRTKNLVGSE
ncbi:MAG: ABC transporter permease [Rhodocyclaceae bacterium]|nr:ABC transporter permease [Rhodocyclaceae bacterium]